MRKLTDVHFINEKDYPELKKLWQTSFDDTDEELNSFFEKTVLPDNALAIFDGENPVSVLYMLESEIAFFGERYSAYYVYAVCTHPDYRGKGLMTRLFDKLKEVSKKRGIAYLFLVPESETLFEMYKKQGFRNGFYYNEKSVCKPVAENVYNNSVKRISYGEYEKFSLEKSENTAVAFLDEKAFNSFFSSVNGEVHSFSLENGYALYLQNDDTVTVYEYFGDEKEILNVVFSKTNAESVTVRIPSIDTKKAKPYGMYLPLGDYPEIKNAFFGISYST